MFVNQGIHTTKHLVELIATSKDTSSIDLGLDSEEYARLLEKLEALSVQAEQQKAQQRHTNAQPARQGWKKRYSIVSKKPYFEHLETGKTQWTLPEEPET